MRATQLKIKRIITDKKRSLLWKVTIERGSLKKSKKKKRNVCESQSVGYYEIHVKFILSLIMRNRWLMVKFSFAHAKLARSKIIRLLTLRTILSFSWSDLCCFVVNVNENLLFLFSHLIESSSSTQLVLLEFSQLLISVWFSSIQLKNRVFYLCSESHGITRTRSTYYCLD